MKRSAPALGVVSVIAVVSSSPAMCLGCQELRESIRVLRKDEFRRTYATRFPADAIEIGSDSMNCGTRVFLCGGRILVFTPLVDAHRDWFGYRITQPMLDLRNARGWFTTRRLPKPVYMVFATT